MIPYSSNPGYVLGGPQSDAQGLSEVKGADVIGVWLHMGSSPPAESNTPEKALGCKVDIYFSRNLEHLG